MLPGEPSRIPARAGHARCLTHLAQSTTLEKRLLKDRESIEQCSSHVSGLSYIRRQIYTPSSEPYKQLLNPTNPHFQPHASQLFGRRSGSSAGRGPTLCSVCTRGASGTGLRRVLKMESPVRGSIRLPIRDPYGLL